MELLAPAGDLEALHAALDSGADAVYFGVGELNARRRARNFAPHELAAAVEHAHARGARAYLTLNIDLVERELGQAARMLELARQTGVDAVLVRDPAVLALRPLFPSMQFHLSTQTCVANSADVRAALALGADRVVLAREMSLGEIAAASTVEGVATEVFVQGALCFSISGRCLMSSWVGGRSGNRGACTSPCRVPWTSQTSDSLGTPMSMRDLAGVRRLEDLARAGVRALKIEGRLKKAEWVARAVRLYRKAIDEPGADPDALMAEAARLGAYTGRELTCGYFDAKRDELTGLAAGREARGEAMDDDAPPNSAESETPELPQYELLIDVEDRGIVCRCTCGSESTEWTLPKTVVRRPEKAVPLSRLFERLEASEFMGYELGLGETNEPDYLLVPRAYNAVIDSLSAAIRRAQKGRSQQLEVELPPAVRRAIEKGEPHAMNRLHLGDPSTRVRLEAGQVETFVRQIKTREVIVEGVTSDSLGRVLSAARGATLIVALPPVFFEADVAEMSRLVGRCAKAGVLVEVNNWGGWQLARQAKAKFETGPGLPVLNSIAARFLGRLGARGVTLSLEADRRQLEAVTAVCPVPCSLVVFGRPALMISRVDLPREVFDEAVLADRRGVKIRAGRERGLWVFRPEEPFDLRNLENDRLGVRDLVVDLVGSPDPVGEWHDVPTPGWDRFRFNYDRTLA